MKQIIHFKLDLIIFCRSATYNSKTGDCRISDMDRHTVSSTGDFELSAEGADDVYLENNCVDDPVKLCDFQLLENRIMKTVDSVYQVSFIRLKAAHWKCDLLILLDSRETNYVRAFSMRRWRAPFNAVDWMISGNQVAVRRRRNKRKKGLFFFHTKRKRKSPEDLSNLLFQLKRSSLQIIISLFLLSSQDVPTMEACRDLCLTAPYRCHSFDYGDTGERVCRLSHHTSATLTQIQVMRTLLPS